MKIEALPAAMQIIRHRGFYFQRAQLEDDWVYVTSAVGQLDAAGTLAHPLADRDVGC